jgi:hypothetical protein
LILLYQSLAQKSTIALRPYEEFRGNVIDASKAFAENLLDPMGFPDPRAKGVVVFGEAQQYFILDDLRDGAVLGEGELVVGIS